MGDGDGLDMTVDVTKQRAVMPTVVVVVVVVAAAAAAVVELRRKAARRATQAIDDDEQQPNNRNDNRTGDATGVEPMRRLRLNSSSRFILFCFVLFLFFPIR